MGGSRGGQGVCTLSKKSQNIGLLSNTGLDPLKNHKATKPAFNVGPSSARQRTAITMAFRWRAEDGQFIVIFGSSIPSSTNKKKTFGPPLTKLSGSAHVDIIRATTSYFKQCGILTSVHSDEPVQPPLSLEISNDVRSVA